MFAVDDDQAADEDANGLGGGLGHPGDDEGDGMAAKAPPPAVDVMAEKLDQLMVVLMEHMDRQLGRTAHDVAAGNNGYGNGGSGRADGGSGGGGERSGKGGGRGAGAEDGGGRGKGKGSNGKGDKGGSSSDRNAAGVEARAAERYWEALLGIFERSVDGVSVDTASVDVVSVDTVSVDGVSVIGVNLLRIGVSRWDVGCGMWVWVSQLMVYRGESVGWLV